MQISTRTHRVTRQKIEEITSSTERMNQVLLTYGPGVIELLMEKYTLRQIARRSKRSPTYMSHIKNGKARVSWETYCILVMMLEESENVAILPSSSRAR